MLIIRDWNTSWVSNFSCRITCISVDFSMGVFRLRRILRWAAMAGLSVFLVAAVALAASSPAGTPAEAASARSETVHLFLKANGQVIAGDSFPPEAGKERQGSIELLGYEHSVITAREAGSGLATGRRQYQPLLIRKRIDKASPLLMKALSQNQVVEAELRFYRPNPTGDGTTEHYYTIKLTNARIASVEHASDASSPPMEEVTFVFHTIQWTYTNGGVTHEDTWDSQR